MKRTFRRFLSENLTFKIISIALAIFLWFFVTFKGQTETSLEVPIEFKNTPSGMEILKQNVKKVTISVSARERILKELMQNNVRVVIDLSNVKLGENLIPITKSSVKLPRGIEILRIEPSQIKIYLDEKSQKIVPVKVVLTGNPSKGFYVAAVSSEPSSIKIEGAKRELDRIRVIKTETIDIEGISEDLNIQAKINPEGKIFRTDRDTVYVNIKLRRQL
ncbi:MAG: CdaR family protein [Thermodesulfovibrio sp.]|nr:CdaR family protein [Thermodesulfovibrio sp.]MCX7724392.1 CdaR family protein [Thermodesulfovibrio sp.]MDW7972302.1 CdaR family protein [Thermodesulfovibrio sp.]